MTIKVRSDATGGALLDENSAEVLKMTASGSVAPAVQVGNSTTASNNFTITPNGSGGFKISRGNVGATTADILSIASDNKITLLQPLDVVSGGTGDTGTAWTVTGAVGFQPSGGSFSSASGVTYYKRIGKTVFFNASLTITNNGTGSGAVLLTLPFTSLNGAVFSGRCDQVSGKVVQGVVRPNQTGMAIYNYDNTYPGATGEVIRINGVYETT